MPTVGQCLCGSGKSYDRCCGVYHRSQSHAPTAQALMRSRYAAHALGLTDYLLATWHPSTRPQQLDLEKDACQWIKLKIKDCQAGLETDTTGTVEFEARYRISGKAGKLCERSQFVRENDRWYYVQGEVESN